jgi:hypothetical protein
MKIKITRKAAAEIEVDSSLKTFLILDAAKMRDRIEEAKRFNGEHECLYKGEAAETLHHVGPWLFSYPQPSIFSDWYLANMGNQNWGILIQSTASFKSIYLHLKKFLLIKTEAGEKLYFRFYDPRVLPTFLETADEIQLSTFFGPIDKIILENEQREIKEYQIVQNNLVVKNSDFFQINSV